MNLVPDAEPSAGKDRSGLTAGVRPTWNPEKTTITQPRRQGSSRANSAYVPLIDPLAGIRTEDRTPSSILMVSRDLRNDSGAVLSRTPTRIRHLRRASWGAGAQPRRGRTIPMSTQTCIGRPVKDLAKATGSPSRTRRGPGRSPWARRPTAASGSTMSSSGPSRQAARPWASRWSRPHVHAGLPGPRRAPVVIHFDR